MVTKKQPHKSRSKKTYVQSKQSSKLKDRGKIQVYLSGEHRALVERAIDILEHGTLSSFCAQAAVKEAKKIIALTDNHPTPELVTH